MNLVESLQLKLKNDKIRAYLIPTSDYHQSEYISDYFKARAYVSGFTGSAGTLVITAGNDKDTSSDARLWTDGRYFLQAEEELKGSSISLMKMGQKNIPTIFEYLASILASGDTFGFDGKVVSTSFINNLDKALKNKKVNYKDDLDLMDLVWPNRPSLPKEQVYILEEFFAGKSYEKKIAEVREKMREAGASHFLLTALEDQAWLYNMRGNDVLYTPVFLAYSLISQEENILYVDKNKLSYDVLRYLKENKIKVKDYNEIYEDVKDLKETNILVDPNKVNYTLYKLIKDTNKVIFKENPTLLLKAIKNEVEIKNTKLAHIKDGVAFTKFMYYVKHNVSKSNQNFTEITVSNYLYNCRKEQKGFIEPSFNTICGFGPNASMLHYSATPDTDTRITEDGFLLVDSGGQYLEGTTDITRTLALGHLTDEMKLHFTTVLKSVIALSKAVFMKGVRGINLDILARGPIWKLLIDYRCGTGHGVGHILSVHEGPNGFRWQIVPERNDSAILLPGMITTNEPGIYLDNKYGIRLENEMLCKEVGSSEFGDFLGFETITYAPIDLDGIDENVLTKEEKDWLNQYHQLVFETLKPYFEGDMLAWLTFATRKI